MFDLVLMAYQKHGGGTIKIFSNVLFEYGEGIKMNAPKSFDWDASRCMDVRVIGLRCSCLFHYYQLSAGKSEWMAKFPRKLNTRPFRFSRTQNTRNK